MTTKTASGAEHRLPLELPTPDYQEDYMLRLINQLRIVLELIPSKQDVENESSAISWFMS
tara:strand:- start:812 stop:991 length:180 start_codon:yes stop_codon:yes gene_type:complete